MVFHSYMANCFHASMVFARRINEGHHVQKLGPSCGNSVLDTDFKAFRRQKMNKDV